MTTKRGTRFRVWALALSVVLIASPFGATSTVVAQDTGVTRRVLADGLLRPPGPNGVFAVTRLDLAPSGRTDSLLFDGPVVIAVESGQIEVWTRAGTTLDGIPVTEPVATIYAERQQSLVVPAGVRFRIRSRGCTDARLLFIRLIASEAQA